MHLDCDLSDYPHCIAVFRRGRCWGAISKTNHAVLRYREPIYRTIRELALSYFHEYFLHCGRKTLRRYSLPFDLRAFDARHWMTSDEEVWFIPERLTVIRHYPILQRRQIATLRNDARTATLASAKPNQSGFMNQIRLMSNAIPIANRINRVPEIQNFQVLFFSLIVHIYLTPMFTVFKGLYLRGCLRFTRFQLCFSSCNSKSDGCIVP